MKLLYKMLRENKLPPIYTVCKSIDSDPMFAYFLVLDFSDTDNYARGIIFNKDGAMQSLGNYDITGFEDEWTWDKTEDKVHGTFLNYDYIYMHESLYELKLIVHDKPIRVKVE